MRLSRPLSALLIAGLAMGLVLSFGCTTQQEQQTAGSDVPPTDTMPQVDEPMGPHHGEQAEDAEMGEHHEQTGRGHEMGEHHQEAGHHGDMPELDPEGMELSGTVQDGVRVVEVSARQYEFEPETIVLKKGQPARLLITSQDVTHGFDIEGMDIDVELPPNETQTVDFTPQQVGQHHFYCSVYCGPGHDEMHGTLVIKQ